MISAIILAVALAAVATYQEPVEKFTVTGDGQDVVVYNRFPDNSTPGTNFSEDMVAATNLRGTVWLETQNVNASEMQEYCDEMLLKNIFRPLGELTDEWYKAVAEKNDQQVCIDAVEKAEANGFL